MPDRFVPASERVRESARQALLPTILFADADERWRAMARDALLEGLSHLPPDERIVIVLRYWADLPLDGIADRLGWPLGSVKSRLHRALGRLGTRFSVDGTELDR